MSANGLRALIVLIAFAAGSASSGVAADGDLAVLPEEAILDGPKARQRFLVEARVQGAFAGDLTPSAKFAIDNPRVAVVSADGVATPTGDGVATLTATVGDRTIQARIQVRDFDDDEPWSFSNHVLPAMTKAGCNQGACHGAAAGKNGFRLTLRGYGPETDFLTITRQANGRRIRKTQPEESLLLLKATGAIEHGGGVRFAPDSLEYRILTEWIASGAPAPSPNDPKAAKLIAYPRAVALRPGQTQQITVQAVYSDGRIVDATPWAKFGSSDDAVAKVDEATGLVRVEGRGEAAITVWFASLVERVTISSPYESAIPDAVYAQAPRSNFIDDKNLDKLQAMRIAPAGDCGDLAFLRRASLDATGVLPTIERVDAFLKDQDPRKRAKLIEELINSPEFVDYWSYKWSDLLLVSSAKLAKPAVWSFYEFVRGNVRENRPWDQFARAIVTAKGSTLTQGAANYYVLHRDPIDLTETTGMAFLGLSLTCARCHNHPLEKWTQDQYYGMANLFARIKLKDGDGAGNVIVAPTPEGEIRHPRTGAVMAPQPLDGKALAIEAREDRREALADWLAAPNNPYFAHAVVNRIWANFFGRGLIHPEDDLRATNPPADEALMAALVDDFRAHGYDVKRLIRTIMTSAVYARSSEPAAGDVSDPKFLSRYPAKRLSAEVLLDAVAQVTAVPSGFEGYPPGYRSLQLPDSKVDNAFLNAFGRPQRLTTCSCERSSEPSAAQALHMANGSTINDKLRSDKGRPARWASEKQSDDQVIDQLFKAALSRPATPDEIAKLKPALAGADNERRQAIEDLFWAVLTSKEFLFNH